MENNNNINDVFNINTEEKVSPLSEMEPTTPMENDIRIIRKWVQFFGYLTIASMVITFIWVLVVSSQM